MACSQLGETFNGFSLHQQISHGHTRPDIVAKSAGKEVAWLDITSEGSLGHILKKQGAGWSSRPYVAEVTYEPPDPHDLLSRSKDLTPEQKASLKKAKSAQAEQAAAFERGRQLVAVAMGEEFRKKIEEKKDLLSRTDVRECALKVCKEVLPGFGEVRSPAQIANGVLRTLDDIEVGGKLDNGGSLAGFGFKGVRVDGRTAVALLIQAGKPTKAASDEAAKEADSDVEMGETDEAGDERDEGGVSGDADTASDESGDVDMDV